MLQDVEQTHNTDIKIEVKTFILNIQIYSTLKKIIHLNIKCSRNTIPILCGQLNQLIPSTKRIIFTTIKFPNTFRFQNPHTMFSPKLHKNRELEIDFRPTRPNKVEFIAKQIKNGRTLNPKKIFIKTVYTSRNLTADILQVTGHRS